VSKSAKSGASVATRRRRPTQERSQRRYETIVEAAAESFADFGFDATTMEGIAARADTSIGSLYQFFPNKHALFREVVRECLRRSRAHFERLLGGAPTDWRALLGRVIDGYRALQDDAYMKSMWRNMQLYGVWMEDDEAMLREFIAVTAGLIGHWAPNLTVDHRRMIATTVVNAIAIAMLQITRVPPGDRDSLLAETQRMLERYLEEYVEHS
jgi:AcrR family transcriptional regulator